MPPDSVLFVAPQGRPAPAPWLVYCSGLLRLFMAPEGREKSPEKGARHSGRLRWPHAAPDPKGGSRGALTQPRCAHDRVATCRAAKRRFGVFGPRDRGALLRTRRHSPHRSWPLLCHLGALVF